MSSFQNDSVVAFICGLQLLILFTKIPELGILETKIKGHRILEISNFAKNIKCSKKSPYAPLKFLKGWSTSKGTKEVYGIYHRPDINFGPDM